MEMFPLKNWWWKITCSRQVEFYILLSVCLRKPDFVWSQSVRVYLTTEFPLWEVWSLLADFSQIWQRGNDVPPGFTRMRRRKKPSNSSFKKDFTVSSAIVDVREFRWVWAFIKHLSWREAVVTTVRDEKHEYREPGLIISHTCRSTWLLKEIF